MRRSNASPRQAFDSPPPPPPMDQHLLRPKPSSSSSHSRRCCRPVPLLIFTASALIPSFIFFSYFSFSLSNSLPSSLPHKFSIVIDGGSTGTRVHVYSYKLKPNRLLPVLDLGLTGSLKVGPGLSFYVDDPDSAGESLVRLVEFAKRRVPEELWGETEIRLMGTAGLRMVERGVRERILESCRKVLNGSGFVFEHGWATVISGYYDEEGTDEGIYAWVAANYALGTLGGDPQKTTGIFELGGASAQITFVSSEPLPPEFLHVLQFGEIKYNLYSHSFLHLGQDLAQESLRELLNPKDLQTSASLLHYGSSRDPCTPEGYSYNVELLKLSNGARDSNKKYQPVSHAFGNFSECRSAALMLLQKEKDKCVYSTCLLGSTFIPKLQGRFIATENFFYTSKFFGLRPATILSDLVLAGEQFCEENWLELKKKYPTLKEEELLRYCFSSAYIVALLHDSLGIPLNDKKIQFANQVEDVPLDWALGAFIMQMTSKENLTEQSGWMAAVFSDESSASLSFLVVSMVLIFTVWSLKRWRKPQVKTIYDLEKGRYITTRMLKS